MPLGLFKESRQSPILFKEVTTPHIALFCSKEKLLMLIEMDILLNDNH